MPLSESGSVSVVNPLPYFPHEVTLSQETRPCLPPAAVGGTLATPLLCAQCLPDPPF